MTNHKMSDEKIKDIERFVQEVENAIHQVVRRFARGFLEGKRDENEDLFAIWYALLHYAGLIEAIRNHDCGYERCDINLIYEVYTDGYNQTVLMCDSLERGKHD